MKILLGITGSIAASKTPEIIAQLKNQGHHIKCIITKNGEQFVDLINFPLESEDIFLTNESGNKKFLNTQKLAMDHINLAKWADLIVISPASANIIAKLASGIADELLSSTCLASTAKIIIAPAMNKVMWEKNITQENIKKIYSLGVKILGPAYGEQACGDVGYGRMIEPTDIVKSLNAYLASTNLLTGKKILITAGPTQEPIDPVRYIGNRSSGKMGFALADALIESGADVTLISGPVNIGPPGKCKTISVKTAQEMFQEVITHVQQADVFISCAAVSDYRPEQIYRSKIKKAPDSLTIKLIKNPDILKEVALQFPNKFIVGFAAETENLEINALRKLQEKQLDMIIANEVGEDKVFNQESSSILILDIHGNKAEVTGTKMFLSQEIIKYLNRGLRNKT